MKFKRIFSVLFTAILIISWANAKKISFSIKNGETAEIEIPDDLAPLIEQNKKQIENALINNSIDKTTAESYGDQIKSMYDKYAAEYNFESPYGATVGNLNKFSDALVDTIPNTQGIQNIYADAWIGNLIPNAHFGAGINVGASSMDVSSLKKTAEALDIDAGDIPDTLVFPTINADLRVGGFILPFDVGIAVMKFDSSSIGAIKNAIDPMTFDYYVFGGDIRYALLEGGILRPKVSVGAGYYYTSGSFGVNNDEANAALDFSSKAFLLEAQASIKLLCLIPFIGTKLIYSKTNVDWDVGVDLKELIPNTGTINNFNDMVAYGILPEHFNGGSSNSSFHPQIFGGVGFDFFVLSATISLGYDIKSEIISGALSTRISW